MVREEAYYKTENKIEEALKSGATDLDLSNEHDVPDENQLTELPDAIGKLIKLTSLKLSSNKLTALPESIGQLTQLTYLDLSSNQLMALPESIGQLTQLTYLDLSSNQLMALPESIGQLTQLTYLDLSRNPLTTLPNSLGQLTQLQSLDLSSSQLTALPDSLGQLTLLTLVLTEMTDSQLEALSTSLGKLYQLRRLEISNGQITKLPESISRLSNLRELAIHANRLRVLPNSIGDLSFLETLSIGGNSLTEFPNFIRRLSNLKILYLWRNEISVIPDWIQEIHALEQLDLSYNPLHPALKSAYDAGLPALMAYLHSLEQNAEPLYEAKLVLVGEGNVGKTTLLKALKGDKGEGAPKYGETTTHGVEIDIHGLRVPHPAKDGVEIQLNAWDFGGQDVYRVTHQFFFSRRSLYLLVWEPRRGVQQGQVEDWLNMIRLRVGDEARVLIVSTHCKTGERIARIDKPVFKQQYGDMIVGFFEVDSLVPDENTGEMVGIAELKKVIAEESAKLQHMGMPFNLDWKAARDELVARPEPHISYTAFAETCARHGLSEIDTTTLAEIMNDLGYIVHYSDDEKLRDDVVLKPEWLTKAIGFVLEDRATAEREGILPDNHLYEVWHNHSFGNEPRYDPVLYPFFLRLMEKYDVSYRLPEGDASLVAQHVPQVRPGLPWLSEEEPKENQRRLGMVCVMDETPPGLIPWMIVRTHDYAYPVGAHSLHWQKGMFLRNERHGEAMLELRGREFHIYAEAIWPEYFMNVLRQTLDKLITDNWPGLEGRYSFTVPCKNKECEGRFEIAALREFLNEGDETIRCQRCRQRQNIIELLYGFEDYDVRKSITKLQRTVEHGFADMGDEFEKLRSQIANNFLNTMKAMASEAKTGPRLFTIEPVDGRWQWVNKKYKLHLWCEAEDCQHPVYDGLGVYEFKMTSEWIAQIAPYANFIVVVMKTLLPMVAPSVNVLFGSGAFDQWKYKDHLNLIQTSLSSVLPEGIKVHDPGRLKDGVLTEMERSGILALHSFLRDIDPDQERIGLYRIPTYTGDFTWVCRKHYDLMQPKIPDVIQPHG
jgi:internalin A